MSNDAFLVLFIVLLAVMGLVSLIFRRFRVPGVIALLIVGMVFGPNNLNLVHHLAKGMTFFGADAVITETHFNSLVNSLGSLGLIFLMALAGMEADFKLISYAKKPVLTLSLLTFLLPAVCGFFVYYYFRRNDFAGMLLYASLFASHSVGIVFPVIRELKLSRTVFGTAVLISTVLTDISSIILLAVSVQIKRISFASAASSGPKTLSIFEYLNPALFGNWFLLIFLLIVLVYMALSILLVYQIGQRLMKIFQPGEDLLIPILLLVIMLTVLVGEILGVNLVVGAFIAGLALSRLVQSKWGGIAVLSRFESIGYGFLVPFLFVSIGMKTDFSAFASSAGNLQIVLFTVVGLVGSKMLSGWLALRSCGFSNRHGLCAGLMTVPQLSATLAAAAIGKDLGMLDDSFFNAVIVLSIVTTLPVPSLVRMLIEKGKMTFRTVDRIEEEKTAEAEEDEPLL